MADNITYRFIQNVGDYFPSGYFSDDFIDKVQKCAGRTSEEMKELCTPYVRLRSEYEDYKNFIVNANPRPKDAIARSHQWHTSLLKVLGYDTTHAYEEPYVVSEKEDYIEMIPVRHILRSGSKVSMLIMEMQHLISVDDSQPAGLFEQQYDDGNTSGKQRYYACQWSEVIPAKYLDKEHYHFSPAIINKAITQIFLMPEERRPHFILMLAGNTVFLFDQDKWARGSYLQFSLDDLYTQAQIKNFRLHYALFHLLVCKDTLSSDGQTVLMDSLIEESFRNAYEVTKDLKEGVILAVETLANEALYYMKNIAHRPFGKKKIREDNTEWYDETDDDFESEVKDDCIVIVYRLLFILFAESRPELDILPTDDEVYKRGYSFESLRDLEQVHLVSQESRDGYFFDSSIHHLFHLLSSGYHPDMVDDRSFSVRPIDSPMFNDKRLKQLQDIKIRNVKWQEIIRALSLSRGKKYSGRISYANLGVNQLGSVYESLLAFRGFYAEEDYIEVHKAGDSSDDTFLVPYSRMSDFTIDEVLTDPETGEPRILPCGTFVYRLNGRDREKSASYYTPEVLTKSTVKYTIKQIVDDVRDGKRKVADLLDLKILEPAVGAAAFLNEAINQLAEAYMTYVPKKPSPDQYRNELQKVKAYIATHNVYGVDLNPTAIELGKLSLWLNVIHKDMETPFFANRLSLGNAVIGAWLKVYSRNEVIAKTNSYIKKRTPTAWWEKTPHKVKFYKNRVNRSVNDVYHFLLPDKNMLGVLSIKEQRTAHPAEATRMREKLKDWTKAVTAEDYIILQRISAKIDVLLYETLQTQVNIERHTNNKKDIWPHEVNEVDAFKYYQDQQNFAQKERIFDSRYRHDNAYYKLRLVMDYWCALWFWEYEDAASLPSREEYWKEIEQLLDVSEDKLDAHTRRALERAAKGFVEDELPLEYDEKRMTEEEAGIVEMSKEDLLLGTKAQLSLFVDEEPERFKIVKRLTQRYHFFHPMLEFIDVFWLRGGFDIILGNPPWVLPTFDVIGVVSEKFPEVAIRNEKAPKVRSKISTYFTEVPSLEDIYIAEQNEATGLKTFSNACCSYPLLQGIQTDLYMCILENSYDMISDMGYIGMVHPESIYDTAKLTEFRNVAYHSLRYHFQYQNEKKLFAEVHNETTFSVNVYSSIKTNVGFYSMHNLFHPNMVDASFAHNGTGPCYGVKFHDEWNLLPHKDRIVYIDQKALDILTKVFLDDEDVKSPKLVSLHTESTIQILEKFSQFEHHVAEEDTIITTGLHETGAVDDGIMRRNVSTPVSSNDIILSGPHIFTGTALYKMPRLAFISNRSYDNIDYTKISDGFIPNTCFESCVTHNQFIQTIKGFKMQNSDQCDNWFDYYKLGLSEWVGPASVRTLSGGILPPNTHHIGTIVSVTMKDYRKMVELSGMVNSLPLDNYVKLTCTNHVKQYLIDTFPLGIADYFKPTFFARTLRLNCLTNRYADLWNDMWDAAYLKDEWSIVDSRLAPWSELTPQWQHSTPLRNYFERRMALVEIDVIAAMALGLSLKDLETMYNIQFPVLQQNENDTWYDAKGNIIFTCSKGLTGVGVDRPTWNLIRGEALDNNTFKGIAPTYVHTIDPQKSELYGGQQVTYYAPYNRMDRIEDYRRAWAHFERIFDQNKE